MDKLKAFFRTSLLGGLTVILPVAILLVVFNWIFQFVTKMIQPLTNILLARSEMRAIIASGLVLLIILGFCFVVGVVVRTRVGKYIHDFFEKRFFRIAPGYNLIKETILQLLGSKKAPFSSVALAQVFGNATMMTCFVTDEHSDGSFTVFVPTGPNPTSGFIFHLPGQHVHMVDVSAEDAMRSVISCGTGSAKLLEARLKNIRGKT